jgi:hypothetical protein
MELKVKNIVKNGDDMIPSVDNTAFKVRVNKVKARIYNYRE